MHKTLTMREQEAPASAIEALPYMEVLLRIKSLVLALCQSKVLTEDRSAPAELDQSVIIAQPKKK